MAEQQPYSLAAMEYIQMVDEWFKINEVRLKEKGNELLSIAQANFPGTSPDDDAFKINDCLEVIRWYQHQIYVKLCRAASGTIRTESEKLVYVQGDADGSAKVAIIGIERSNAAWIALMQHLFDLEPDILNLLVILKRLLSQVEIAFPKARAFIRPGFDTSG